MVNPITLTIDGQTLQAPEGATILEAARTASIYIPTLCHHPDLPPAKESASTTLVYQGDRRIGNAYPEAKGKGCGLCVVAVEGEAELIESCTAQVADGMVVITDSDRIREKRQENLLPIMVRHPHACLTCAVQEGCSGTPCSADVPENERCCPRFGDCELQNVANHVGISPETPRWVPTDLPVLKGYPLFERDLTLCIGCTRCVRACRDLRGVEALGFVFDDNGRIQVGTRAPTLEESGCKFCTACVEVCPTGALTDKGVRPGKKEEDLVPCKTACPANIDVPEYVRLIGEGKVDEANAVIREKIPFPGILGRVCVRPCEAVCRRGAINEPVSICALKRYAADQETGLWTENMKRHPDTGKRIAVVGAGPAGLTAAFYLRKAGHGVTLFDAEADAGGMMRYGIPAFRLPRDILDQAIQGILNLGIGFRPNQILGTDITLEGLKDQGFDAIFLGLGASKSRRISIEGIDFQGVLWGAAFLKQIASGVWIRLKSSVLVIGGGNVAVDAATTALRCGAREVTMACLESRGEMPAHEREIQRALADGIRLKCSRGPSRILGKGGRVTGAELIRCVSVFDDKGNFCPAFGDEKETIACDQAIIAIGQAADVSFLSHGGPISVDEGVIVVDPQSRETGMKGVYAGGDATSAQADATSGTRSVIHAVADGRRAATAINRALGGVGEDDVHFQRRPRSPYIGREEGFARQQRERMPELAPGDRHQGFEEVGLGLEASQALKEAKRCLQCDLRLGMGCNPSPPPRELAYHEENLNQVPASEGVYRLLDENHKVLCIKGTSNLLASLREDLAGNKRAAWFEFQEDKMYSRRESDWLQKYLREHGEMPGGEDEDLYD